LPPSIALGMEPGDKSILEERPRPKKEPVVLGWMWVSMVLNGAVLSAVIIAVYIISLMLYCDGRVFQADIDQLEGFQPKLMNARTVAFISLVWSENVRSYTSRSFDKPIWHNVLGNVHMQKAIVMAQVCLYVAVLVPFFSTDILQLRGLDVGITGWLLALLGPIGCLVLCEACKLITAFQMQRHQRTLAEHHAAEDKRLAEAAAKHSVSSQPPPQPTKPAAAVFSAAPEAKVAVAAAPSAAKSAAVDPESQLGASPQAATAKQSPAGGPPSVGCACFLGPTVAQMSIGGNATRR